MFLFFYKVILHLSTLFFIFIVATWSITCVILHLFGIFLIVIKKNSLTVGHCIIILSEFSYNINFLSQWEQSLWRLPLSDVFVPKTAPGRKGVFVLSLFSNESFDATIPMKVILSRIQNGIDGPQTFISKFVQLWLMAT